MGAWWRSCCYRYVQRACSGSLASLTMRSRCHSEPAKHEQFPSSLLGPTVAQSHHGTVISPMIWAGWESWKEIWVCVNFPPSMCKDKTGTTNTRTQCDQRFWHSECRGRVSISSTDLELSTRKNPHSHTAACLPVNSESTPRKTKSGRAALVMRHAEAEVAGWPGGPLPFDCLLCWHLPGYGNSKWLSELA